MQFQVALGRFKQLLQQLVVSSYYLRVFLRILEQPPYKIHHFHGKIKDTVDIFVFFPSSTILLGSLIFCCCCPNHLACLSSSRSRNNNQKSNKSVMGVVTLLLRLSIPGQLYHDTMLGGIFFLNLLVQNNASNAIQKLGKSVKTAVVRC